ncbi:helicase-exonuclease AddAB subunit AddA [Vagococcus acidifermentans]|uniref:ATP-dependent helicase/nuclease subunit A n=1 Tax=Vagococcus acidifermentans TaxID=564710 RepID=A0A430ATU0_9ENTE|nr:helicase-exonuclease AddAB subunit AddA [Vagococcus acidifermentans]RSU11466.1 helicase-exonuclease AddAB subunit AddA [Vagococcus acidifermentans]
MTNKLPLKPAGSTFTDRQWQAIYDSGKNILVSASAGSGKTTVLVERVIQKIKNGTNVDELLIVTYTEAAAKEMKQRIQAAVQEAVGKEKELSAKQHLMHQLTLLPTANISTLHAFCLQVIRRYGYLIHLDPVFRLLTDETEMLLLKEDVWGELREKLYGEHQEAFYQLTENFSNDRNDDGLMELMFALYDFAKANPSPEDWLAELADAYQVTEGVSSSPLYQTVIKKQLQDTLFGAQRNSERMKRLAEGEPELEKTLAQVLTEAAELDDCRQALQADDLTAFYQLINGLAFPRFAGAKRNAEDAVKQTAAQIKNLRDENKKAVQTIQKGLFAYSPDEMKEIMEKAGQTVTEMSQVASAFIQVYQDKKEQLNLVDFNDLEHYTLQILADRTADGGWTATEASAHYREIFAEVLVDEYQDINRLQESILYWLRRPAEDAGNLFMVGDVKQSIYSFRLADPTLFIEKYEAYGKKETKDTRIVLPQNFRSRSSVLDFTNLVFMQLMNRTVGQIDYDEDAQLITGATKYAASNRHHTELLIYETSQEEEDAEADLPLDFVIDDKTEGELRVVGQKIKELIAEKFPVFDKETKGTRPIQYRDIVLLTPTKKNNLTLLDMFKTMNIPLYINDTQNYFQATEIRVMLALFQMIDNPLQDIPVAAVLRSPLVGIKENDMVAIRSYDAGYYYEALTAFLENADQHTALYQKVSRFHDQFLTWRELSRREELVTLIWRIYQDTGFLDYVGGLPSGKQRQANLHALYERAASYEESSFKGLFQFIRFIEKMQQKDKDLAEPTNISDDEDAVRVMTIHASKGLEFPVVFVLDMTKRFNQTDIRRHYIFDEKLGAGIKYVDTMARLSYVTLPYLAIRQERKAKLLAEEMRKLYVALTRAEEKLFLVGSYKDRDAALKEWAQSADMEELVLADDVRLNSQTFMKWVGMSLMRHPDMADVNQAYPVVKLAELQNHPARFAVSFFRQEDLLTAETAETEATSLPELQPDEFDEERYLDIVRRLDAVYPHQMAARTTSYQSVSEIKRVFEDPDNQELLVLDLSDGQPKSARRFVEDSWAEPAFLSGQKKVSTSELGTATHLVMQMLDLSAAPTDTSLVSLIQSLVSANMIRSEAAEQIDRQSILTFMASPFGRYLLDNAASVKREQPFSMLMEAGRIFSDYGPDKTDRVLVHGIIDGFIETPDELVLYDFKTDRRHSAEQTLTSIKQRYQGQMNLYRIALEQVTARPVTGMKLILLNEQAVLDMI